MLNQARTLAPHRDAWLLFAHMAHRIYSNTYVCESPFLAEFKQALRSAPSVGGVTRLLRILVYWKNAPEMPQVHDEGSMVRDSLKAALRQPFTREEALDLIERAKGIFPFEKQFDALVTKVLRDDPLDPQFRLFQLELGDGRKISEMEDRSLRTPDLDGIGVNPLIQKSGAVRCLGR